MQQPHKELQKRHKTLYFRHQAAIDQYESSILSDQAESSCGENSPRSSDFLVGLTEKAAGLPCP